MPVENEHKYIVTRGDDFLPKLINFEPEYITQFYISDNARFRKITGANVGDFRDGSQGYPRYVFTYKQKIDGRVLEIEQAVEEEDYLHAWSGQIACLRKTRFKLSAVEPNVHWDIDFLNDAEGATYLVMAEVEHPEGAAYTIPALLQTAGLIRVPNNQAHLFSNRRLFSPDYARTAVTDLLRSLAHVGGHEPALALG